MKKGRIAIIGVKGLPAFGGSARAGENMVNVLKEKFDFTIYTVSSHTLRKTGNYEGYRQIVFKTFPIRSLNIFIYYLKSTFHCLFMKNYDVVHVFHIDAAFIIPILKLRFKVIAGHRARPQESSKWGLPARFYFHLMEIIFYKMPAHVITSVSKPIIDKYQPLSKRKMQYIPNGILIEDKKPDLPKIKDDNYILFAAGRIMETKGCHVFLEALNRIKYSGKAIIIGSLKHELKYAQKLYDLSVNLNIKYIDLIKDKYLLMAYIKKAKFAVYPSFLEAMSNMLLEIASLQTPLICSDIPENTIVFNEEEAIHFISQNSDDLAQKIKWALDNPDKIKLKAVNAYQKIIHIYNWNNIAMDYERLYNQLIINK